ncbi:hypothetical protein AKJ16_DCAP27098 [Drosera capensis]
MANATGYPPRSEKSVINRFSVIRTKCLKFASIVQNIKYPKSSGFNEQDKLSMVIVAWTNEEKEKEGFKLLYCYNVLKNSPKWITEISHPTANRSMLVSDSINIEDGSSSIGRLELSTQLVEK